MINVNKLFPRLSIRVKLIIAFALVESTLFGHERGAFTGAVQRKEGLLSSASGGTVFLDEIGDLSTALQAKLLRVLEQRQMRRLGSTVSFSNSDAIMHNVFSPRQSNRGFDLGTYRLRTWHRRLRTIERVVVVPANGDVRVDLSLAYGSPSPPRATERPDPR